MKISSKDSAAAGSSKKRASISKNGKSGNGGNGSVAANSAGANNINAMAAAVRDLDLKSDLKNKDLGMAASANTFEIKDNDVKTALDRMATPYNSNSAGFDYIAAQIDDDANDTPQLSHATAHHSVH